MSHSVHAVYGELVVLQVLLYSIGRSGAFPERDGGRPSRGVLSVRGASTGQSAPARFTPVEDRASAFRVLVSSHALRFEHAGLPFPEVGTMAKDRCDGIDSVTLIWRGAVVEADWSLKTAKEFLTRGKAACLGTFASKDFDAMIKQLVGLSPERINLPDYTPSSPLPLPLPACLSE